MVDWLQFSGMHTLAQSCRDIEREMYDFHSIFEPHSDQPTHLQSTMSSGAGAGGRGNGWGGFGRARRFKKKVFILNGN